MAHKRDLIAELMKRMNKAHALGWYLESAWYAYAIIEDRLLSILRSSGGDVGGDGKSIQMLGRKIGELEHRIGEGKQKVILIEMNSYLQEVEAWADTRNDLMHSMSSGAKSLKEIDRDAKALATEALELVPKLANGARRLKKHAEQTPSVSGSAVRSKSEPRKARKKKRAS